MYFSKDDFQGDDYPSLLKPDHPPLNPQNQYVEVGNVRYFNIHSLMILGNKPWKLYAKDGRQAACIKFHGKVCFSLFEPQYYTKADLRDLKLPWLEKQDIPAIVSYKQEPCH